MRPLDFYVTSRHSLSHTRSMLHRRKESGANCKKGKRKNDDMNEWIDTRDWGLIAMDWWVCMSIISWVASVQWLCKYFSVWQRVIRCWCTSDKHPIPPTIIPVHVFIPHWPWRFQHNTISDGNCEHFLERNKLPISLVLIFDDETTFDVFSSQASASVMPCSDMREHKRQILSWTKIA